MPPFRGLDPDSEKLMSKQLFTAGADVASRDKCLGVAALGASMQQGWSLCASSEPPSALPPVRAAPQPQSCSLIPHLPPSKTAAQGKAGTDQSRTLSPTFSGYEKPSQLLFPSPWLVLPLSQGPIQAAGSGVGSGSGAGGAGGAQSAHLRWHRK